MWRSMRKQKPKPEAGADVRISMKPPTKAPEKINKPDAMADLNLHGFIFDSKTHGEELQKHLHADHPFFLKENLRPEVRIVTVLIVFMETVMFFGELSTAKGIWIPTVAEALNWPQLICGQLVGRLAAARRAFLTQNSRAAPRNGGVDLAGNSSQHETRLLSLVQAYIEVCDNNKRLPFAQQTVDDIVLARQQQLVRVIRGTMNTNPKKLVTDPPSVPPFPVPPTPKSDRGRPKTKSGAGNRPGGPQSRSMSPGEVNPGYRSRSPLPKGEAALSSTLFLGDSSDEDEARLSGPSTKSSKAGRPWSEANETYLHAPRMIPNLLRDAWAPAVETKTQEADGQGTGLMAELAHDETARAGTSPSEAAPNEGGSNESTIGEVATTTPTPDNEEAVEVLMKTLTQSKESVAILQLLKKPASAAFVKLTESDEPKETGNKKDENPTEEQPNDQHDEPLGGGDFPSPITDLDRDALDSCITDAKEMIAKLEQTKQKSPTLATLLNGPVIESPLTMYIMALKKLVRMKAKLDEQHSQSHGGGEQPARPAEEDRESAQLQIQSQRSPKPRILLGPKENPVQQEHQDLENHQAHEESKAHEEPKAHEESEAHEKQQKKGGRLNRSKGLGRRLADKDDKNQTGSSDSLKQEVDPQTQDDKPDYRAKLRSATRAKRALSKNN